MGFPNGFASVSSIECWKHVISRMTKCHNRTLVKNSNSSAKLIPSWPIYRCRAGQHLKANFKKRFTRLATADYVRGLPQINLFLLFSFSFGFWLFPHCCYGALNWKKTTKIILTQISFCGSWESCSLLFQFYFYF